ncbi:MAG: hypothetical protein U5N55_01610 [Cypionkella sp.]|nr:hypothetical protein [Cypionkella sp.]
MAIGNSLLSISRMDGMPDYSTIWRWRKDRPEFDAMIPRARAEGAHVLAEQCLDIADSRDQDMIEVDGQMRVDHDVIARAKLRIDTRMRLIGKWNAASYGEKLDHTSSDGSMTPKPGLDVSKLSTEALAEIMRASDATRSIDD